MNSLAHDFFGHPKLYSMVRNIVSEDWADPRSESVTGRELRQDRKINGGIVSFHVIQANTVLTLPLVIVCHARKAFS